MSTFVGSQKVDVTIIVVDTNIIIQWYFRGEIKGSNFTVVEGVPPPHLLLFLAVCRKDLEMTIAAFI
jgi:hypothetical protein